MSWLKAMTRKANAKAAIDADRIAPPLQEAQTETALRKEATPLAEAVGAAGAPRLWSPGWGSPHERLRLLVAGLCRE